MFFIWSQVLSILIFFFSRRWIPGNWSRVPGTISADPWIPRWMESVWPRSAVQPRSCARVAMPSVRHQSVLCFGQVAAVRRVDGRIDLLLVGLHLRHRFHLESGGALVVVQGGDQVAWPGALGQPGIGTAQVIVMIA